MVLREVGRVLPPLFLFQKLFFMIRKVYSYPGIAAGDVQIRVGKALIKVPFANGYLDKKMSRPAVYSTGDPVMQSIIESSDLFGHRIFLQNTYGSTYGSEGVEPAPVEEPTNGAIDDASVYPEVTNWEEAVKVLKAIPGVKVTSLRTPDSAKKVAESHGVVFPNYNFE